MLIYVYICPFSTQGILRSCPTELPIRRTASLDALYLRPSVVQITHSMAHCIVLQMDKSTQTLDSYLQEIAVSHQGRTTESGSDSSQPTRSDTPTEIKIEKALRHRLHRGSSGVGAAALRGAEHSVSSQTLSPIHGKNQFHFTKGNNN